MAPMGLNEDVVDLFEIDDANLVAHGLNEGGHERVSPTIL